MGHDCTVGSVQVGVGLQTTLSPKDVYVCMHLCTYVSAFACMYACMCVHVCACLCIHVCLYIHMYVYMTQHMYIYIYIETLTYIHICICLCAEQIEQVRGGNNYARSIRGPGYSHVNSCHGLFRAAACTSLRLASSPRKPKALISKLIQAGCCFGVPTSKYAHWCVYIYTYIV